MDQRNSIQQIGYKGVKRFLVIGGCLIACAGLSACDMGEGSITREPQAQAEETKTVFEEADMTSDTGVESTDKDTEVTDISGDTDKEADEMPAESGEEENEASGGYETQGQTYHNRDLGFELTAPDDWVVEPEEWLASIGDDVHYLAHKEDDSEYVSVMEVQDSDGSVEGSKQVMRNPEAYCNEVLRQSPRMESCEVDTIKINGVEYVLTVSRYLSGEYDAFFVYGEKDGVYNITVSVYSTEKERIYEILSDAISGYEAD